MTQIIAFTNDANKVSILSPILNSGLTLEQIAEKDVPDSSPYIILDESELPDRADRDRWVIEGSSVIIDESMLLPATIRTIDARRLRLALLQLNLLDKVEVGLSKLGKAAQIDWEYATEIKEDYPLVISLSTELGLNVGKIFDVAIEII